MSELASVTTVPPAGAMIDGLHVNELAVCAYALGASSVHVIRQMPRANAECFVEPLTRYLLSTACRGTSGCELAREWCKPSACEEWRDLAHISRGDGDELANARLTNRVRAFDVCNVATDYYGASVTSLSEVRAQIFASSNTKARIGPEGLLSSRDRRHGTPSMRLPLFRPRRPLHPGFSTARLCKRSFPHLEDLART